MGGPSPGASRHPLPVGEGLGCGLVPLPVGAVGEGGAKRRVRVPPPQLTFSVDRLLIENYDHPGFFRFFRVVFSWKGFHLPPSFQPITTSTPSRKSCAQLRRRCAR